MDTLQEYQTNLQEAKQRAIEFLKGLDDVYNDDEFLAFDEIVKLPNDEDPEEVTVEVSPYWGTVDEINGGSDTFDYGNKFDMGIDDIPLLKKDLVIRVISRDYDTHMSETVETVSL